MHVALNLVYLVPGETGGMETYARELIPELAARDDVEVTCLVNREAASAGDGPWGEVCPMEIVPVRASSRIEWVRGEQQHVPRLAAQIGADLVHSLASTAPLWGRVPRVTTIHDLNYLLVPEAHFGLRALGMRALVPASARRSRRVIVDASSTRDELVEHLGLEVSKIDVAPLAAKGVGTQPPTPEAELRTRLGLGDRRVLLSPGAKRPHKNLTSVLDALARIPPAERPVVVATGYATPYEDDLRAHAERVGVAAELVMPSWLGAADLEGLYAIAVLVVFVSRAEGFGLPVLEAMARGVPVIASNRSSLPEVAGDAAVLADPDDAPAIAAAISGLLADAQLRFRMAERGRERAATFSWARTATLTVDSYGRALRMGASGPGGGP